MSLENVKVGDWIKVQVTEIDDSETYPIKCGKDLSFIKNGNYIEGGGQVALPVEVTERWMMVSLNNINWEKRKVFAQKSGKFIAWSWAENDESVLNQLDTSSWKYAKEIEEHQVEVTLEEIAEKFGVNVNQIKIKK
jgi:hypothetical protein